MLLHVVLTLTVFCVDTYRYNIDIFFTDILSVDIFLEMTLAKITLTHLSENLSNIRQVCSTLCSRTKRFHLSIVSFNETERKQERIDRL